MKSGGRLEHDDINIANIALLLGLELGCPLLPPYFRLETSVTLRAPSL